LPPCCRRAPRAPLTLALEHRSNPCGPSHRADTRSFRSCILRLGHLPAPGASERPAGPHGCTYGPPDRSPICRSAGDQAKGYKIEMTRIRTMAGPTRLDRCLPGPGSEVHAGARRQQGGKRDFGTAKLTWQRRPTHGDRESANRAAMTPAINCGTSCASTWLRNRSHGPGQSRERISSSTSGLALAPASPIRAP